MKPAPRLASLDPSAAAFFDSPYALRAAGPSTKPGLTIDTSLPAKLTPASPLLAPSPGMLEGGGSYPFPSARERGGGSFASRLRYALAGKGGRGTAMKRVVVFALVLGSLMMMYHKDRAIEIGSRYAYTPGRLQTHAGAVDDGFAERPLDGLPVYADGPHSAAAHRPPAPAPAPSSSLPSRPAGREIDIASDALPVSASLRERLDVWRNAPGGRGEVPGEVELGGFNQWNLEQCGTIEQQHNTHMIQHSANVWSTMNRTTLHDHRMTLIHHMEDVLEQGLLDDYGEGRGIVTVAGNADTLHRVKWLLQMLRSYDSTLPVQIYHFPSEKPAVDDPIIGELRELGAELVEARGQRRDEGKNKSYHLKALAVVQCPWREVLYIDSDSIPARDPEYMFDAPNYKRLGIWATPDKSLFFSGHHWTYACCRNEWEMETGQIFVDKKLHLDVFLLAKYMLENHEWWFFFSDGDKDIFRWALLMLRKRWGVPGRWVGAAALPAGTASGSFCAHTMLQHDSWGEPLFVHYNLLKQIPSGVGRGFSWGRTKQMPLFNLFPASPATARLGEPLTPPDDGDRPGLGDVDCDMLADADEYGVARAPAQEMIMRRAVRERGIKVRYHGGVVSALCIDLDYVDPRPQDRRDADRARKEAADAARAERDREWDERVARIKEEGGEVPERPEELAEPVLPDWEASPLEIVQWGNDPHLQDFERKIYDFGFKPSGPGF
ncbi:hypothetical protein Q5752_006406 [Cryptotrichosporon argae]